MYPPKVVSGASKGVLQPRLARLHIADGWKAASMRPVPLLLITDRKTYHPSWTFNNRNSTSYDGRKNLTSSGSGFCLTASG